MRQFYTLDVSGNEVVVQYNEPSLQKIIIELHMGHGPVACKTYRRLLPPGCSLLYWVGYGLGRRPQSNVVLLRR